MGFFGGGWVLGFELRSSHLQNRCSTGRATPLVHFPLVFLEMWSYKLFAQAGLHPPEATDTQLS
jgi:hypothetical protein